MKNKKKGREKDDSVLFWHRQEGVSYTYNHCSDLCSNQSLSAGGNCIWSRQGHVHNDQSTAANSYNVLGHHVYRDGSVQKERRRKKMKGQIEASALFIFRISTIIIINIMKNKQAHGFLPVLAAFSGNFFIMIIKWIGFFMSGSGALFSEAVHSVADVFNQLLLMVGVRRSLKPSDNEFHYGYGNERFFWALISACSIFFLGAGVTIYHGFSSLIHREVIHIDVAVFIILGISFLIETGTLFVALKEILKTKKKQSWSNVFSYGDPATIAVLLEDSVAVVGVGIAFLSILMTKITGIAYWDSIGSIVIGILLGVMALILININRGFLVRKSIPEGVAERVREIMEEDPAIEKVLDFKSVVIDIDKYRVKCEVEINGSALMRQMYRKDVLKNEFEEMRNDYEEFLKFCVDYADRVPRMIGNKIDEVEKKIKDELPEIRHIDIEVN